MKAESPACRASFTDAPYMKNSLTANTNNKNPTWFLGYAYAEDIKRSTVESIWAETHAAIKEMRTQNGQKFNIVMTAPYVVEGEAQASAATEIIFHIHLMTKDLTILINEKLAQASLRNH